MTGYSDEQIEALIAAATPGPWEVRNLRDSQNDYDWWWVWRQGVTSYAGVMDMDADEEPGGVGLASITDRDRSEREQADAEFIAAARELVPSLLARAQQAEAEVAERLRQFNAAKDQRDAALAEADRLRAELAEAKAEAEELRRLLLDETYRPEGGEIVMRELNAARSERDSWHEAAMSGAVGEREAEAERDRLQDALRAAEGEADELRAGSILANEILRIIHDAIGLPWSPPDDAHSAPWADSEETIRGVERLAAQVAAVQMTLESMEAYGLPASVVTPQEALTWAVAVVRNALDGTEQDESAGDA